MSFKMSVHFNCTPWHRRAAYRTLYHRSNNPFAWVWYGVVWICIIPSIFKSSLNIVHSDWRPRSAIMDLGTPNVLTQELKKFKNSKSNVFMTSYDATNIIIFNVCQKIYEFLNSAAFRSNGSQSSRRLHCSNMCVNYSDHIL